MPEAKLQFRLGALEFAAEGTPDWVVAQLDKFLERVPELTRLAPSAGGSGAHSPMGADAAIAQKPLATYLREKNATENQTRKFLATAAWLEAKGKNRMKTADITAALRQYHQARLGNASQCLSSNIEQGWCEHDGDNFYVTDEGKRSLG